MHDLGKFNPEWQAYFLKNNGEYEESEYDESDIKGRQTQRKVDHSIAGAIYCLKIASSQKLSFPKVEIILSYLIAGHHTGLPDWDDCGSKGKTLQERLSEEKNFCHLGKALKGNIPEDILSVPFPKSSPGNKQISFEDVHLWIRMLYSCLVDADYLDTEYFMTPDLTELRSQYKTLQELKVLFDLHMIEKQKKVKISNVNKKRQEILEECREKASSAPGLFSLTVPTGGGKTLSSMAFALEHALLYSKKRIIVVIPYTSIIEQTADEYKKIFGAENVIEHHCNLAPEKETVQSKLAAENWDAPIIVTTNVQLFESLFSSKSSSCRKLHNIVNSVIILDEAQTLPPEYLKPILLSIKSLVRCFGVSVVLCTATQPSLIGMIGSHTASFNGFDEKEVREIISDIPSLFQAFQRVQIKIFGSLTSPPSWNEIAEKLKEYDQVLCIVNTKKDCSDLYDLMPEGTMHLSGYMCARHRSRIIQEIKQRLQNNLPIRVICTQLIEAGVHIDFPIVFRALSGLDSIAQASGRCNREGELNLGTVYVFKSPNRSPCGFLRKSEDTGLELYSINPEKYTLLIPENYEVYFKNFYSKVNSFDKKNMNQWLIKDAPVFKFQFRKASTEFRMINDSNQYAVIVKYKEPDVSDKGNSVENLIEILRLEGFSKYLLRQFQGYTVNVFENQLEQMKKNGVIEEINGLYVQSSGKLYDSVKGLQVSEKLGTEDFFCVEQ